MIKSTQILAILLCFAVHATYGQVNEQFTDGDFTFNPVWFGDDSLFNINQYLELQSKGTAGTSKEISLTVASYRLRNTEFSCLAKFNLNPSTQNFCRFYLCADNFDLKTGLNAYYIQFGGSTGATDSVTLWRQTGQTRTRILASRPGIVGKNTNQVRIKVLVNDSLTFKLYTDTTGNENYFFEAEGNDLNAVFTPLYSGAFVRFTSTNVNNYFFDDFYIGEPRTDTIPPFITEAKFLTETSLQLVFNEPVHSNMLLKDYYQINGKFPLQVVFKNNQKEVVLTTSKVTANNWQQVEILSPTDMHNNSGNDTLFYLPYVEPKPFDILITELMADPDPVVGLPNAEFIELYNNTAFPINLLGYRLTDGSSTAVLPNYTINPNAFIIICSSSNNILFSSYGPTIGVSNFPSLNNSGDMIRLTRPDESLVHEIKYDLNTYRNNAKSAGGYSLELIYPNQLCNEKLSWQASEHPMGGTPGQINSIFDLSADSLAPGLILADIINKDSVLFTFNEQINISRCKILIQNEIHDAMQHTIGYSDSVWVKFKTPALKDSSYTVLLKDISDCSYNITDIYLTIRFIPSETAYQNDLVINEIMHSPSAVTEAPNVEFIEIYNRSNKAFNLQDYTISDGSSTVKLPSYKLYPDSFVVVCGKNNAHLFNKKAIGVSYFPTLSSTDKVILKNQKGLLIHGVYYQGNWHKSTLKESRGGYSLELINPKYPCAGYENWSASEDKTGATPGYKNSIKGNGKPQIRPWTQHLIRLNNNHLLVHCNTTLDSLSVQEQVNNWDLSVINWGFHSDEYNSFWVQHQTKNNGDSLLTLPLNLISNCEHLPAEPTNITAGISHEPDSGDLLINEILFNPVSGQNDFIELYNSTNKYVKVGKLLLGNADGNKQVKDIKSLSLKEFAVAPGDFIVITPSCGLLTNQYHYVDKRKCIENALPSFNDNEGGVFLLDSNGKTLDQFFYTESMHHPMLPTKEGVSLERVNALTPWWYIQNWQSASAFEGFATPTRKNSNAASYNVSENLSITPEVFYPGGSKDAIVAFSLAMPYNGYTITANIYNSSGNLVKRISEPNLFGKDGIIYWNGLTDENTWASAGIYLLKIEAMHPLGSTIKMQKTFVAGLEN